MRWLASGAILLLVGLPALWARDDPKDKPKEPEKSKVAQEVDAIIAAHQKAVSDFYKDNNDKIKDAKTAEERSKIFEAFPKTDATVDKLWDLLDKNPKENDAAITGLQWIVHNSDNDEKGQKGRTKAMDLLIKDHAGDPEIAAMLSRLTYTPSAKAEELIRAVMEKNPSNDAKGKACLALGSYLKRVSETVRRFKEHPEEAKQMESYIGKDTMAKLKDADADKLAKEAEARFEEAAAKYSDVVLYSNPRTMKDMTVGASAAGELFEIRNLAIGKTVPEITGDDLDGKGFKLSDYRGKVVVLDFWGNW
jgi:AhpC/TSA family